MFVYLTNRPTALRIVDDDDNDGDDDDDDSNPVFIYIS
jgi:hypothetical protein